VTDDEIRQALVNVLPIVDLDRAYEVADTLLPVVRKAQAAALRQAANDWILDEDGMFDPDTLRQRANTLDTTP
jgi:hypothetical protein